jgi:glyceraldehyde 3-phosphate dehydrogenase
LEGRLEGSAIRVPTANVSLIDFAFMPKRSASSEEVNQAVQDAASGRLHGVLGYETAPLVSCDFNHSPLSSVFAPAQTTVTRDGMIRVLCWYDNEWGFSNRMIDTGAYLASLMAAADQPICVNA